MIPAGYQPCQDLGFCNQNGDCIGEYPDDFCECFSSYAGEDCNELDPAIAVSSLHAGRSLSTHHAAQSTIETATTVAVVGAGGAAASGGVGGASALGVLPFLIYMQK